MLSGRPGGRERASRSRRGRSAAGPEPQPVPLLKRPRPEVEEGDLWRALLVMVGALLLVAFVLATGWVLIREGIPPNKKPGTESRAPTPNAPSEEEMKLDLQNFVTPLPSIRKLQEMKPLPPGFPLFFLTPLSQKSKYIRWTQCRH